VERLGVRDYSSRIGKDLCNCHFSPKVIRLTKTAQHVTRVQFWSAKLTQREPTLGIDDRITFLNNRSTVGGCGLDSSGIG
jgi:hypothetical protein